MSRLSAPLSATSQLSATINGYAKEATSISSLKSPPTEVVANYRGSISLKPQDDSIKLEPDDLFAEYTIPEVKAVQQKLRAGADQKRQELRLMVGERYRDILQASASIISIAESSKNVLGSLDESNAAILRQQEPLALKGLTSQTDSGTHLHALQQLGAHIKLLIDAPENLWRLIERKKYFPAAWLFLLVRVVHRSLIRDNEREEGTWRRQGINVLLEFPLVQRQWDAVSQFRSQIIHKATLSLRDLEIPPEDACAALVTLHLLDSRPLTETFSVYLNQRTRTLSKALSQEIPNIVLANGRASHSPANSIPFAVAPRTSLIQEVREAMRTVLLIVTHTVKSTRDIFEKEDLGQSLMYNLLKDMQADNAESTTVTVLPPVLSLNTSSVLAALPSSISLQLLPSDLKDYKPYIDLDSSSSMVSPTHLATKLDEWLGVSIGKLEKPFQQWLEQVQCVNDVWNLRASVWKWVSNSHLRAQELSLLFSAIDSLFRQRILGLWRATLRQAQDSFSEQLSSSLICIAHRSEDNRIDFPVDHLFHSLMLPQLGFASKVSPFERHYAALQKRLLRRTRLLDAVLGTLENCARAIQDDISTFLSGGPTDSRNLAECLVTEYQPLAHDLCGNVIQILDKTEKTLDDNAGYGLAFLYEVEDELASSSCFLMLIGCSLDAAQKFRRKLAGLYDKVLDRWKDHVVSSSLKLALNSLPPSVAYAKRAGPSPELLFSLITLSEGALQLGLPRGLAKQRELIERTLKHFISQYLGREMPMSEQLKKYDLVLLQQLAKRYGAGWHDLRSELAKKVEKIEIDNPNKTSEETLARCQNLLVPLLSHDMADQLLDDKQGFLLPIGTPVSDTQYQSPIPVAKPGPRLGQLLVDGSFNF